MVVDMFVKQRQQKPNGSKRERKKQEEATQIMLHVHKNGVGVCGTFTHEVAEAKCKSVMELAKKHEHPLQCTMEKN